VYSSESSSYLADQIYELLYSKGQNVKRGGVYRKQFPDGEKYYRVQMQERYELVGKDVIYVSSTADDSDFLELIRLGCAFSSYGSRRRIFIIPFLGYSTMERQVKPGEVITAKVNLRLLSAIPETKLGNTFMLLDLHVQGLLQYFEGASVRMELYAEKILIDTLREKIDTSKPFMFASADLGRPLWVEAFAREFGVDMAFVRKHRDQEKTEVKSVIGSVAGHHVIIYDDMTRTGGTLINAAEAYLAEGATKVTAVLSHFALATPEVIDKLGNSVLDLIIATNSHPMSQHEKVQNNPKFFIVDVAPLFVEQLALIERE